MRRLIILLAFMVSTAAIAADITPENFRKLVHELVSSGDLTSYLDESIYQKDNLRGFLFDNPQVEKAIQEGRDLNSLFDENEIKKALTGLEYDDLDKLLKDLNKKRTVKLSGLLFENLETLGHIVEGDNLSKILKSSNLGGLTKDLSQDLNVKKLLTSQINNLLQANAKIDKELLDQFQNKKVIEKLINALNENQFKAAKRLFDDLDPQAKIKLYDLIPEDFSSKGNALIYENLQKLDFSKNKAIAELSNAEFNMPDKNFKELAEKLVKDYFNKDMPLEVKWSILEEVLELSPVDHAAKLEVVVLKNTDLMFQKSLQAAADKSTNNKLKLIGKKLKAELNFIDEKDLMYMLKKSYPDTWKELKNIKQVAAATTGVGCLADFNGKKVWVKVLRPGLDRKVRQGEKRFLQIVGDNIAGQNIVTSITGGVLEEINMVREAFNYEVAKVIYADLMEGLDIPGIVQDFPATKGSFVMELASGKNISKIDIENLPVEKLQKLNEAYQSSLKKWFRVSMNLDTLEPAADAKVTKGINKVYKKYFDKLPTEDEVQSLKTMFNGDLHGGNVFVDFSDDYPKGYKVTWIDWGNAHTLSVDKIRGQVKLTLGATTKSKRTILNAIKQVVEFTPDQEAIYIAKLDNYLKEALRTGEPGAIVLNKSINMALQSGANPPKEIINWGRGKGMLETTIIDRIIPTLQKHGDVITADAITKLYTREMVSYIIANSPKQLISSTARAETVLPLKTTGEFILNNIGYLGRKTCHRLFNPKQK